MGEAFADILYGIFSWVLSIVVGITVAVLGVFFSALDAVLGGSLDITPFVDMVVSGLPGGLKICDFFVSLDALRAGFGFYLAWLFVCLGVRFLLWVYLKFWGANP